jgi:hypothetical protein
VPTIIRERVGTPAFAYGFGGLSPPFDPPAHGTLPPAPRWPLDTRSQEDTMGRGLLLWLIGIPIPIILIIWLLGGLHG